MIRTIEATIDEHGGVVLQEAVALSAPRRALVTILEEEPHSNETALLSEAALAEDWNRPEEDTANKTDVQKQTITSQNMADSIVKGYIFATREDEQPGPMIEESMRPHFDGKMQLYKLALSLIVLLAEEQTTPALLSVRDKVEDTFFASEGGDNLLIQIRIAMQNLHDLIFSGDKHEMSWAASWFKEMNIEETNPINLCLFALDWMKQFEIVTHTIRTHIIEG